MGRPTSEAVTRPDGSRRTVVHTDLAVWGHRQTERLMEREDVTAAQARAFLVDKTPPELLVPAWPAGRLRPPGRRDLPLVSGQCRRPARPMGDPRERHRLHARRRAPALPQVG